MTTYEDYIKIFPKREYEVCERAGILEFDAGLSRKDAEKKAIELNIQEHLRGDDDGLSRFSQRKNEKASYIGFRHKGIRA